MTDRPVRTRIAPSPTGDPHVGTAYMGLVNMVYARQHGGQFLLRIDDTDRRRYRPGSEQAIFAALRWLGLDWDEGPDKGGPTGPYRQSERTAIYQEKAAELLERGKAYRCFCTEDALAEMRRQQKAAKSAFGYDGRCRALDPADVERRAAAGEPHVIRLMSPTGDGVTAITDLMRGPIETPNAEVDDKVLLKADGYPTYHLASVVDDHLMGITHIIRAEEWISSGAVHRLLFEAFDWEVPVFCHMPLLRNADKSKISKRRNPTSLLHYREAGFLPAGFLNFLALLGWGGPKREDGGNEEIFDLDAMIEHFRLEEIKLGGPVFDLDKLHHVNGCHVRALELDAYVDEVQAYLFDRARLKVICALAQPRTETFGQFVRVADFFLGDVDHVHPADRKVKDPKQRRPVDGLVPKKSDPTEAWFVLSDCLEAYDGVDDWTAEELEAVGRALATEEATGWKPRDLFMALRVAFTGKAETPPLFETMVVLGRARCLGRLGQALKVLPEPSKKARARREKDKRKAREAKADGGGEAAT